MTTVLLILVAIWFVPKIVISLVKLGIAIGARAAGENKDSIK